MIEAISATMGSKDNEEIQTEARKIGISCCTRIGAYKLGCARPISVSFQIKKEDKERIMEHKRHLPPGIYINDEFPPHVKKARDKLRPILKLAKSKQHYKDKSKLVNDKLVINGISYTVDDLGKLPSDLAAYQATQKTNEDTIVFQGELSPWLNFHTAPFVINNQRYNTLEHWIQSQKALLFNDIDIAKRIMDSDSPYEAKKLGYQVQGIDMAKQKNEGYQLCFDGIKTKFQQNPDLLNMLQMTTPKLLAEGTTDKIWGTGIHLCDSHALDRTRWNSNGWLSDMLMDI